MPKPKWSPFTGLTPRGKRLMRDALRRHKRVESFMRGLEELAQHNQEMAKRHKTQLEKQYHGGRSTAHTGQLYNTVLWANLLTINLSAVTHMLRHSLGDSATLEIATIHILHSNKKRHGALNDKTLTSLLGEHGLRLHAVEENFSDFERRVSGTLGDIYSRLSAGRKLESEK
jgi:hypothetical protein